MKNKMTQDGCSNPPKVITLSNDILTITPSSIFSVESKPKGLLSMVKDPRLVSIVQLHTILSVPAPELRNSRARSRGGGRLGVEPL